MVDPAAAQPGKVKHGEQMRAEREEDEFDYKPIRRPERRLAYEIALGIVIGGLALGLIQTIAGAVSAGLMLNGMQINWR